MCQEFTIDRYCTVKKGDCVKNSAITDAEFGMFNDCFFDYVEKKCSRKPDTCDSYYKNCNTHSKGYTACFDVLDSVYCQPVYTDDFCQANTYYSCTNKTVIGNNEKCSLYMDVNRKECKKKLKTCEEYNDETSCNSAEDCVFINNYCYSYQV